MRDELCNRIDIHVDTRVAQVGFFVCMELGISTVVAVTVTFLFAVASVRIIEAIDLTCEEVSVQACVVRRGVRDLLIVVVTATIGLLHLPHSIAGNVEVLFGLFTAPAIGVGDYLAFLGLATAGNAVGGAVFVALLKYGHVVRGAS